MKVGEIDVVCFEDVYFDVLFFFFEVIFDVEFLDVVVVEREVEIGLEGDFFVGCEVVFVCDVVEFEVVWVFV